MAKKRKASGRKDAPSGPKDLDPADARLGPINSYEDVADSEDEYFLNQDRLMFDDEPDSKRRRKADDDISISDEEILGYNDSEDEDDEEPTAKKAPKSKKAAKKSKKDVSDEEDEEEEQEGDEGYWGSSKKEYYNADNIETEADALEEEAEAKRLQQKKLSKMADEDFMFDGDEWLAAEPEEDGDEDEAVTEVLKDMEITDDMGPEERYRILKTRYPEFEHLVADFEEQSTLLEDLKKKAKAKGGQSLEAAKYWVLGCYVASLASYFAILTSPARDVTQTQKTLDPADLRDHEIMETLVTCREAWKQIKDLKSATAVDEAMNTVHLPVEIEEPQENGEQKPKKTTKKSVAEDKAAAEKKAKKAAKAKAVEDTVADLYDLPLSTKKGKKQGKTAAKNDDSDSDFGEEASLDARTAADKAARKKSLKFYTSQITQKANKRAGAGRDAGGDMDIPYRERLRDRQARLLKEAERRNAKGSKGGDDLGDNSDDDDVTTAKAMRNEEDEYYDMVAHNASKKKGEKAARYAAYAAAGKADRVIENEEVGEDGKRKITYAIDKNKGLTPRRKKDVRNPRVKKKKQYEAKQKKLSSMKPVWKGGEPKGGYKGELSGINTNVIKSVKL